MNNMASVEKRVKCAFILLVIGVAISLSISYRARIKTVELLLLEQDSEVDAVCNIEHNMVNISKAMIRNIIFEAIYTIIILLISYLMIRALSDKKEGDELPFWGRSAQSFCLFLASVYYFWTVIESFININIWIIYWHTWTDDFMFVSDSFF